MAASLVAMLILLFFFIFLQILFKPLARLSLDEKNQAAAAAAAAAAVGYSQRRLERKLGAKRETIQNQKSKTQEK
jgi:hypothetical protein